MIKDFYVEDFVQDIPRDKQEVFDAHRRNAFTTAQKVYDDRVVSYNVDRPCYEEQVYGPISLVSEIYKRARRLASLTSPVRDEPLRQMDINRILDACIDTMNYLSWLYALVIMLTGHTGNSNSDDSPDYLTTVRDEAEKILHEEENVNLEEIKDGSP